VCVCVWLAPTKNRARGFVASDWSPSAPRLHGASVCSILRTLQFLHPQDCRAARKEKSSRLSERSCRTRQAPAHGQHPASVLRLYYYIHEDILYIALYYNTPLTFSATHRHRTMLNAAPGAGSSRDRQEPSSGSGRDVSFARSIANPAPNEKMATVAKVLAVWRKPVWVIVMERWRWLGAQQDAAWRCV